jgi:hypothetical protein
MKKKMILFLVLVLLLLVLLTNGLQGEEKEREGVGFITGNKYLNFAEGNKEYYVTGLMDMLYYSTNYYVPKTYYLDIAEVTKGMGNKQIMAIFDKYLEEHPEKWHYAAAYLFSTVIGEMVMEKLYPGALELEELLKQYEK